MTRRSEESARLTQFLEGCEATRDEWTWSQEEWAAIELLALPIQERAALVGIHLTPNVQLYRVVDGVRTYYDCWSTDLIPAASTAPLEG